MIVEPFALAALLFGLVLLAAWNARRLRHVEKSLNARLIEPSDLVQHRRDWELLTERETEIAHLIAQGMRNYEIARELSISASTVNAHLRSIYAKLGVRNRTELVHAMRDRLA